MNGRDFKKGIGNTLLSIGFETVGGGAFVRSNHDSGVSTIVSTQKSFDQWYINVGFWLDRLGGERPNTVQQSHLYFRLERLVPEYRETILLAGALLDEPDQPNAYQELRHLLATAIDSRLQVLGTEAGLRQARAEGRLIDGLVRKDANDWLQATAPHQGS
jgi:hypothetical protein